MARWHNEKFKRTVTASARKRTETSGVSRGDNALIYEGELEIMARFAADYPSIETGVDLFGFWTHT